MWGRQAKQFSTIVRFPHLNGILFDLPDIIAIVT